MTIVYINTGSTANSGDGDSLRSAFNKVNQNFRYIAGDIAGFGFTGSKGEAGGYTGSAGTPGAPGINGYVGSQGTGYTGSASTATGYTGSAGIGYTGSAGTGGGTADTGSWTFDTVTATTDGNIIVKAGTGTNAWASLLSNNGANSFWVDDVGAHVTSNFIEGETTENYWTFGTDGNLTFPQGTLLGYSDPGGFIIDGAVDKDIAIYTYSGADAHGWTFGTDGILTLPGGNTQISNQGMASTSSSVVLASVGATGGAGLEWISDAELSTSTKIAFVIANNPLSANSGTVQIATGGIIFNGPGQPPTLENVWDFGKDGTLTIPDDIQDANGSVVRVATTSTAPTRVNGQLWFNTIDGRGYIRYNDTWIDLNPTEVPAPSTYLDGLTINDTTISAVDTTATVSIESGANVWEFGTDGGLTFPDSTLQTTAYTGLLDRLSSGTATLVITEDGTVTLPVGTIFNDTTASVVVNLEDALINGVINYSTTSTDQLAIGTYGNESIINAPYTVTEFAVTPPVALLIGDIISGAGYPVPSPIIFSGTGTWTSIVITSSDFSDISGTAFPIAGQTVTIARPKETLSFNIHTPDDTSLFLNPGQDGNIILGKDLIPLENNVQSLGSVLNRWRHLWLGGGSIFIKDEIKDNDVGITARNDILTIIGSAGLKVGEFTFQDNQIVIADNSRDIIVGTTTATGYVNFNRPVKMTGSSGNKVFEISRDGLVGIYPKQNISISESAFSIVGNAAGLQQPRNFTGTMLQITGQNGISTRVSIDAFGTGAYPLIAGRAARGTVQTPTAVKNKDILLRFSTQGYGDNQYVQSIGRITVEATQDFTNATAGTQVIIQTTPNGSNVITTSTVFNDQGIDFDGNVNGGITFYDRSRQTTAFTGTVDVSLINNLASGAVTSISINNDGLSGSAGPGTASINNTGVIGISGTANQIYINTIGRTTETSGHFTLRLPQDIAPTSNVRFNDVNIDGQLNFLGTLTNLIPNTVEGTTLILGSSATNISQLDGGGIILGNTATNIASILWNRTYNYWDFDGSGINTQELNATTATLYTLTVLNGAHFGDSNIVGDYDNAAIQVDSKTDNWSQIVFQNHSSSTYASTDFVATNEIGTDTSHYIDMGINSSNYNDPENWAINGANDGYLYIDGGKLAVGTTQDEIVFFTGDPANAGSIQARITTAGLNVVSTVTSARFHGPLTGDVVGNVTGTVSGNAGSVTNGVYSNQTYTNPTWIGSLAGSKISGAVALATTVTNGVYTTDSGTVTSNMLAGNIANNKLAFNQITFTAGVGIGVSVASPSLGGSTTISNTGVTRITTGSGIIISTSTGEIVISAAVPQGPIGYTGSTGTQGVIGYTGSTGTQGVIGYTGSTGTQGVIGYTGSTGTQGVIGYTGSTGTQGVIGYTGSKGVADIYVSSITTGTGIFVTTSTGAVTVSLNTATTMKEAVSLVSMNTILAGAVTIDPPSFGKNTAIIVTATITGLTTNHHIVMMPSTATIVGFYLGAAYCTGTNVVSLQFHNVSGGNIDMLPFNLSYLAWV